MELPIALQVLNERDDVDAFRRPKSTSSISDLSWAADLSEAVNEARRSLISFLSVAEVLRLSLNIAAIASGEFRVNSS
jgi:hypothetical protein